MGSMADPASPSLGFVAYSVSDVNALVDIVLGSSEGPAVSNALIFDRKVSTPESYKAAQKLLKQVLEDELVEKNAGALKPEKTRLAGLVFKMEDARLVLDEDGIPVFRPESEDSTIQSLGYMIEEEIIRRGKEKDAVKQVGLSAQLFTSTMDQDGEDQVRSLKEMALLAFKVHRELDQVKLEIQEIFRAATQGTTTEQLQAKKEALEQELQKLNDEIADEERKKAGAEKSVTDLDAVFKEALKNVDLKEDIPKVSEMMGADVSSLSVDAIFQAIIDQYEMKAEREKAKSLAQSKKEDLQTKRLQVEGILESNEGDRDRTNAKIVDLQARISDSVNIIATAGTNMITAENTIKSAENDIKVAEERISDVNAAQQPFDSVMSHDSWVDESSLSRLQALVYVGSLRASSRNVDNAMQQSDDAKRAVSNLEGELRQRRNSENSAYNNWQRAKSLASSRYNTYLNTASQVKRGCRTVTNPDKGRRLNEYNSAVRDRDNKKRAYDNAVNLKRSTESRLNSAKATKTEKENALQTARQRKQDDGRAVQEALESLKTQGNSNKMEAQTRKTRAESEKRGFEQTIERESDTKKANEEELVRQQESLQETQRLIASFQSKLNELILQQSQSQTDETAADAVNAAATSTPEQESAAALELRNLVEQRKSSTDAVANHAKKLTQLRSRASEVQVEIETVQEEIGSPAEARDQRRLEAELERKDRLREAIALAAERLQAILAWGGYESFAPWSGNAGEAITIPMLRLLVADIKASTMPVEINRSPPQHAYAQQMGNQVSDVDINSVERIVNKLQQRLQQEISDMNAVSVGDLLQAVESQVRLEFLQDSHIKPSQSILLNDCVSENDMTWKDRIINPSTNLTMRIVYECKHLYESTDSTSDWMVLRSVRVNNKTPLEDTMSSLVSSATLDWALVKLAKCLVESLLKHKSLDLANIEDLGTLVSKFEDLRGDANKSIEALNVFRNPVEVATDDVSFLVAKSMANRMLLVRDAVLKAEREVVDASEVEIVRVSAEVRSSFGRFNKALFEKGIEIISSEIMKRKTAILSGEATGMGSAADSELSALDELINSQQLAIDQAQKRMEDLEKKSEQALKEAEKIAEKWKTCETSLNDRIDKLEADLATKKADLAQALLSREATESEILETLQDSQRLREQLIILERQRDQVQEDVDMARDQVAVAQQELIDAEGEVNVLDLKKQQLLTLKGDAEAKREALREWIAFIRDLGDELKEEHSSIEKRPQLVEEYSRLQSSEVGQQMFDMIGNAIPSLKAATDKFKEQADAMKKLDLRKALEQHLVEYPKLDYQPKSQTLPGVFTIRGMSLCYTEVEKALLDFVVGRCRDAGLVFGSDGFLQARDDSSIPNFNSESIPAPVRGLIQERIARYYQPHVTGLEESWKQYFSKVYAEAAKIMVDLKSHCGITKWDVVRAYATTVEVIVANVFLAEKPVILPGLNFFVTAGDGIHVKSRAAIDTSPAATVQLKNKKARNGDTYYTNPPHQGRDGDNGQNAPAGQNAGHVTLRVLSGKLTWDSQLNITAIGAVGADGQNGGDGDKGSPGLKGKAAEPKETSFFGNKEVSWGHTRYPGMDNDGKLSKQPERIQELGGSGGDGGVPGAGGQGGSGGEVILEDKENAKSYARPQKRRQMLPGGSATSSDLEAQSLQFGALRAHVILYHGLDGKDGTGIGKGGEGGEPGQRGVEKVHNKRHFFHFGGDTKTGFISKDVESDLGWFTIPLTFWHFIQTSEQMTKDWGWGNYKHGVSYSKGAWNRGRPFMTASEAKKALTSELTRGQPGTPGGAGGGGGGAAHAKKREREQNKNVSAEDEYQRQRYQMVQTMKQEELFTKLDNDYTAEEHALDQQINALSQQLSTTTQHREQANEMLSRKRQREEELSSKSAQLEEQLQVINSIVSMASEQIRQNDKVALSKIIASLEQTETISQLSQQVQSITIDRKYNAKAVAQLQSVAIEIQALQMAKQMELQHGREQLSKEIAALTAEMLRTEQMKGELANVNAIAALDALLKRTEVLQQEQITQQQRKQRSVQVEAEADDESIDHLVGSSVLLSVRDTFARGDAPGSIWPELGDSDAKDAVEAVLAAIPQVEEKTRALTVELLEIYTRYCIFSGKTHLLNSLLPLQDPRRADQVVIEALRKVDEQMRWDHWFIASLTGATLMITSTESISVDQASLTSRYEQVEGISVFDSLTKLEREAAKLVHGIETVGPNLQHIAQFLQEYKDTMTEAFMFTRQGYLSILQGNPVRFIDKLSRIILLFFRRQDDAICDQNLELAIGIAKTIQEIGVSIQVWILETALKRVRDLRGGGGYTNRFLENVDRTRDLINQSNRKEALAAMRVMGATSEKPTVYAPRTCDGLLQQIDSVVTATTVPEVASRMTLVARSFAAGIAARSVEDVMTVLTRLKNISFSTKDADVRAAAVSGSIAACATIGINLLSILCSRGDKDTQAILRGAATSRVAVPYLSAKQQIVRVLAFFNFVRSDSGGTPDWFVVENVGSIDGAISEEEANRMVLLDVLKSSLLPYPEQTSANLAFIQSLQTDEKYKGAYEDVVERVAYDILAARPEYVPIDAGNVRRKALRAPPLDRILALQPAEGSLGECLLRLALSTKSLQVQEDLKADYVESGPSSVAEIRRKADEAFENVSDREKAKEIVAALVSALVLGLPLKTVQSLWVEATSVGNADDLTLLVIAMLRPEEGENLLRLRNQLDGIVHMWHRFPNAETALKDIIEFLHKGTVAIVRSVAGNTLAMLNELSTKVTPYLKEALEVSLSTVADALVAQPAEEEIEMYAAQLELLSTINYLIRQNNEDKQSLGHEKELQERDAAYTAADENVLRRVLMACTVYAVNVQDSFDMISAVRTAEVKTEESLRVELSTALREERSLSSIQLQLARRLYVTLAVRSSQRRLALLETDEVLQVSRALLTAWEESGDVGARTVAVALLQAMVLEIREVEVDKILSVANQSSTAQKALAEYWQATLETTTISSSGKTGISPSLLSENERRVQFWHICLSQINDEDMRGDGSTWDMMEPMLRSAEDADEFEESLITKTNSLIYTRRSMENLASSIPDALAEATRSPWASSNWSALSAAISVFQYSGLQAFAFNAQAADIVKVLASILHMLEAKTGDEPETETVKRGDALAWILESLADSYEGMYITHDDDLSMALSSTIEDISRRMQYEKASAKFLSAAERLSHVLEHFDPRKARYGQVDDILSATYSRSEVKRRMDNVDDQCALASDAIARAVEIGDILSSRHQQLLVSFAATLRSEKAFGDRPKRFQETLRDQIAIDDDLSEAEEAKRRLLAVQEADMNNLPSFKHMTDISLLLKDAEEDIQELVLSSYAVLLRKFGGKLHFVLGMAQESEFNPRLGSAEQKALTKQEYNEAAKHGSDGAYNNLLVNSFFDARSQQMSFDVARAQVTPPLEDLAVSESKAQANLALLNANRVPTERYKILPPLAVGDAGDSTGVEFGKFDKTIRRLVDLLESMIHASSSGTLGSAAAVLGHVLGERVDALEKNLSGDGLNLRTVLIHVENFIKRSLELVRTAPPFEALGGFSSTLSHLYSGTDLEHVSSYHHLLLVCEEVTEISDALFPKAGETIVHNLDAMSVSCVRELIQDLLPKLVESKIKHLEGVTPVREALIWRFLSTAVKDLEFSQDMSVDQSTNALQRAQRIVDSILFDSQDPLAVTGMNVEEVFTQSEQCMANIIGSDKTIAAVHEEDGVLRPPFSWSDELSKQCLLHLMQRVAGDELQRIVAQVRESFWSPSSPRDEQNPLQLAEDEMDKVEAAMEAIFHVKNIDFIDNCEKEYQNVFNSGHYLLYLTTKEYIKQERTPTLTQEQQRYFALHREEYKALEEELSEECANMVKVIKGRTQELIDLFAVTKTVHERLIGLDSLFLKNAAQIYKLLDELLDLPGSSIVAMSRILWLLEETDPQVAASLLETSLEKKKEAMTTDTAFLDCVFDLIDADVTALSSMVSYDEDKTLVAATHVADLRRQNLHSEAGKKFVQVALSTTRRMVATGKLDKSTRAASKEEFDALLESVELAIKTQAWRSDSIMQRLEMFKVPSSWVPILDAFSISISLSYDPETTTDLDTFKFQKAAQAVQRLRSRRGPRIAKEFLSCLQLLAAANADATTLALIATLVASRRWPFSSKSISDYTEAARLGSGAEMVQHLENLAIESRKSSGDRTVDRLVEIMDEEKEGVNSSIAHLLDPVGESSLSNIEERVDQIYELAKTHTNASGKPIEDWKKGDIQDWANDFKKVSQDYFAEDNTNELNIMLAVFTRVVAKYKDYDNSRPRNPQLLSAIIFVDSMVRGRGQLGEIGTGEGKSLIVLMCATARVFKGETVDIITSSPVLAERDAIEAKEWFKYFDMNVSNNCDKEAEADPMERQKRYRENPIMYGTTGAFERDILLTKYYGTSVREKPGDSLIVDEVDTLFIDNVANTLYISHDIQDLKHLNDVFVTIWMAVHGKDVQYYSESSVALVKEFIEHQISKGELRVPSWLKGFMKGRLETWIRNAYNAKSMEEGDQYTLYETGRKRGQVVVVDLYTGVEMPSTQWSNGLHQFVQLKHNNKLSAESLKAIFLANVNFVKMYGYRVTGLTGTLGAQAELDLVRRVYGTTAFRMPRFREERYYEEPAVVVGNRARWLERVADEILTQSNATEGFDEDKTKLHIDEQQKKLEKDEAKIKKVKKKIAKYEAEIEETESLDTRLLSMKVTLAMPGDIDLRTIMSLELLISELEDAEFVRSGSTEHGQNRLRTLSLSINAMKEHFEKVAEAEDEAQRLSERVSGMMLEVRKQSLEGDTTKVSELTTELDIAKEERATAEELVVRAQGETEGKGVEVLNALSEAQQGIAFIAESYLEDLRDDLKDEEKELEEERADVEKRTIKLKSSRDALTSGRGGRAVLVICRNKNDCEDVRDTLVARREDNCKLYVYTGTSEGITEVNNRTGKTIRTHVPLTRLSPHDIIVATNIAGRGTSLKTTEVLEQCGGLHVVLSYVPSNVRVELQAWGRTSRQGRNGSGRFVVYDPRVTTSVQEIDIDYLLSERDIIERERLEEIEVETIPRVNLENELFHEFSTMSEALKKSFKSTANLDLQEKELRDQWAFFLESHDSTLEECHNSPEQSKAEMLAALRDFKDEQAAAVEGTFGLVSSPGNLLHIINDALRKEDYSKVKNAAQEIIDKDKQYAGYGYYYHALSLFGSGTDNLQTKKRALVELDKAVYLLNRYSEQLQAQSQVISTINRSKLDLGEGTDVKAFEKSNANIQSLIQVHVAAAQKLTGRALSYSDFDTVTINGDATKEVFDIVNDEEKTRKYIKPLRIAANVEIRLRVTAPSSEEKLKLKFLRHPRLNDENRCRWDAATLDLADVTNEELNKVKELGLAWELALYRNGTEFEADEQVRITFPDKFGYAVPVMLENLRKLAQDESGNPVHFSSVSEEKRSKVREIFFTPLLTKADVTKCVEQIVDSTEPSDYMVMEEDYQKKATGRWDTVGFSGIGDAMKEWILAKASAQKHVPKSEVVAHARTLLEAKGPGDTEQASMAVVDAVVAQGVAKVEGLQRLKAAKLAIIESSSTVISVKSDAADDAIDALPLDDFPVLKKHGSKLRGELKKCKGKDLTVSAFNDIVEEADLGEAISTNSFLVLQTLMHVEGMAGTLCDRLGITGVPEHKKGAMESILQELSSTIKIEEVSKVTSAEELQGILINQDLLEMPRVNIGIDQSDNLDTLTANVKTHMKNQITEVAKRVKQRNKADAEQLEEKTKAMLDDVIAALKGSVTELVTLKGTLKVEMQTLTDRLSDEEVPPELIEFVAAAVEITVKIVKKKTFADYWDWGAFAVAMIGLVQVVAGAALLIVTAGAATQIAGALIGEGVGDMIYAATAGITGTFSWKEYGIQKAISLAITITMSAITCGVTTIMHRAAQGTTQAAKIATKVTVGTVVKAVAKKVAGDVIKAVVTYGVGLATQKLAGEATEELFKLFKDKFQHMAESNAMCVKSVAQIKKTLGKMMDSLGEAQANKYVLEAVSESAILAAVSQLETKIWGAVIKMGQELSKSVQYIGKRLEHSGSKWSKLVASASQWIGHAAKAAGVIDGIQQIVRYLPEIYSKINTRLLGVSIPDDAKPSDALVGARKEEWIQEKMKVASDAIYKKVEDITAKSLTGAALSEIVTLGMNKLYAKTVDKLSKDYSELETRSLASGAIKKLGTKAELTDRERKQVVKLQETLTDRKNKYPSVLNTIDPVQNPGVRVMYNGKAIHIGKLTAMLGTRGLQVLPTYSEEFHGVLVRPKYENYISGLNMHKQANKFDLHAMAKAAKVNVVLSYTENGQKKTTNIDPNDGSEVPTVKMKLLKNDDYPEGRYVLVDDDDNIKFMHEFKSLGSASAAQQLLYMKSYAKRKDHKGAMEDANSQDELNKFLKETRDQALYDPKTKDMYINADFERESAILGGSSPHPLPLVPVPRATPATTSSADRIAAKRAALLARKPGKISGMDVIALPYKPLAVESTEIDTAIPAASEKVATMTPSKPVLPADNPVLARAVKLKRRDASMKLNATGVKRSRGRGVIRVRTSNLTLRRLVGTRVKRGAKEEVVLPGVIQKPRISYVSRQRMKELLVQMGHKELDKPLRFKVEGDSEQNKLAVDIRGGVLRYEFVLDGIVGKGEIKWGNVPARDIRASV